MSADVLIVVPTLGQRPAFLAQTLTSIRTQGTDADIVIVGPIDDDQLRRSADQFNAQMLPDPGSLAAAIECGVASATSGHAYVTWLNDDDVLTPRSLERTHQALVQHPSAVLAYGACEYIDDAGRVLWTSSAGRWAEHMLAWGPDLIPQPGMLVRRSTWQLVGGLDVTLRFAFDLDLLLRLRRKGTFIDVKAVVSRFRWHTSSLTVADRSSSLAESELVKRRYLNPNARRLAWIWERPVRGATRIAAARLSSKAKNGRGGFAAS